MFEFEGHIHGKEIESKLECLALGRYFLQLQIDDEECVHFTWASLSSSGDFSCDAVADCITTSEAVQDALTDFIQNGDFILQGEWTFENTVTFDDSVLFTAEVTFEGGPVNFSDLTINRDEVVWNVNNSTFNISTTDLNFIESNINLDEDSTFTNEGDTILNGDTTIENLTVTNFVLGPGTDLVGMISADANNCLTTGTDGGLYIACGGGGSFTCSDVADCIGSSTDVQDALEAWLIDAITNDADVIAAFNNAIINAITNDVDVQNAFTAFIEGGNFNTTGDRTFDGQVTFNGTPNFTNGLTISGGDVVVNVATDKANQTYNDPDPTWVLPSTPLSEDALHITTSSGTNLILGIDYSISGNTITWIINPIDGEDLYARWLVSTGLIAPGSMYKKTYTWVAGGGDTSVTFADVDIVADSIITGWTITAGTQVGIWEWDVSTPGQITINSSASETGNITFSYSYVL